MVFEEIFIKYWDSAILGFIGGLTVYLLFEKETYFFNKRLYFKNKLIKAIFIFLVLLLLVTLYSLVIWLI